MTDLLIKLKRIRDELTESIRIEEYKRQDAQYAINVVEMGITVDLVEMESEQQWFSTVWQYEEWCEANKSTKPYRVWNKMVYPVGKVMEAVCELSHLGVK